MFRSRKLLSAIPVLIAMVLIVSSARAHDPDALFTPDMTEAVPAAVLTTTDLEAASLPGLVPFNADLVNAPLAQAGGAGVYVAVLDTGLHPLWPFFLSQADVAWELGKGFTHDVSWDPVLGLVFGPLRDDRGFITELASSHGTHVASTVVGFNYNDLNWIEGIAPQATIIPVLVLDAWIVATPDGPVYLSGGTDEMIAAGIYYVADLAGELDAPVVINMSLGGPERSDEIEAAVDYAIANGVIVVASAGNEGEAGMGYPGGLRQIISAGAMGWTVMFAYGWLADVPERLNLKDFLGNNWQIYLEDFSSRPNRDLDQKYQDLDVSTPGAWVMGPYQPAFSPDPYTDLGYYYVSGTSMSAPHVSAMAALVEGLYPGVDQATMESILRKAASGNPLPASDAIVYFPYIYPPYYPATWDGNDYGKGVLKADQAVWSAARHR